MQFKTISTKDVTLNLNNFIKDHYHGKYEILDKIVFLKINKKRFLKIKKGKLLTTKEVAKLMLDYNLKRKQANEKKIENAWNKYEKKIISAVKKRTGINMSTRNFTCYFDPYTRLGFYGKKNTIYVSSNLNARDGMMVISHELFHVYYWMKIKSLGLSKKNKKKWAWDLSEVAVYFLMKEKSLKKFWPRTYINLYDNIKEVHQKTRIFWKKRFEDFILKSYSVLDNGK
jgi:uncharacterized protein YifE (UPF0438 family)